MRGGTGTGGTRISRGSRSSGTSDQTGGLYGSDTGSNVLGSAVAEILGTFILVFVIISVATDERALAGVAPLAVGFALACGVFIAGPITGGSLNPARTLGPMILAGQFTAVWVYIVGPIIGAVLAALLYDRFVSQADATG